MSINLSQPEIKQLNAYSGFLGFKPTPMFKWLLNEPRGVIALFFGNQTGKTDSVATDYVLRALSLHPQIRKNIFYYKCEKGCGKVFGAWQFIEGMKCSCGAGVVPHYRNTRTFRFASENLPGQTGDAGKVGLSAETKNTQYPALKRRLPEGIIKKDITARSPNIILFDPWGGPDIIFEFVSYNQPPQGTAGVQRVSCWEDEEAPEDWHFEQPPRLTAEEGDLIITLTPASGTSWTYDKVFECADVYYRTDRFCKHTGQSQFEVTGRNNGIAVFQASTYDNPTFTEEQVEDMKRKLGNDPHMIDSRIYGIHRQVSGRVFKSFDSGIVPILRERYFKDGIPHYWIHARGIDYHERESWHCGWIALSPDNEAFIYDELIISPDNFVTHEIAEKVTRKGLQYHFKLSLMDALAAKKQSNTGTSVLDDMNRHFSRMKREGVGTGGYWESWDTKSTRGRDEIRMRLLNSKTVGQPFNNKVVKNGRAEYLPTLWILSDCKNAVDYMRNWRWKEAGSLSKDAPETPEQKWSHLNMVWEAIFKHQAFKCSRPLMSPVHRPLSNQRVANYGRA